MRKWLDASMTRLRQRFERRYGSRSEDDLQRPSSSRASRSTSTTGRSRRAKSEPRKTDNGKIKIAPENMNTTTRGYSPNNPIHLTFTINHKKSVYIVKHLIKDLDPIDIENVRPCAACKIRYASIQCDPCTHGHICKYCAYNMLSVNSFPQRVVCPVCRSRLTGFTKKPSGVREEENTRKRQIQAGRSTEERSISFQEYASSLMSTSSKKCQVNRGFEHSGGTGSF